MTIFFETLYLSGGLFDFDLTFLGEGILFLLFSLVVSFVFLSPLSTQLDKRAEFIDFNLRKSSLLVGFGSKKLLNCVDLITQEVSELTRQKNFTKAYILKNFENEINFVKEENAKLFKKGKVELSIKSTYLFSTLTKDLINQSDAFFAKKFQSLS
jgi:hypothetical protein